jgi:hypothetical protein
MPWVSIAQRAKWLFLGGMTEVEIFVFTDTSWVDLEPLPFLDTGYSHNILLRPGVNDLF